MLVSKEHITEYIPQGHPIVMIDSIVSCENNTTITELEVQENNIFVKDGVFQEPGIVENIAQTAAAKAGYEVKKLGAQPIVGFIGAVKDLKIYDLPRVGDVLKTTVTIKIEIMGVTLIDAVSTCNGKTIATCEMKIVLQKPE